MSAAYVEEYEMLRCHGLSHDAASAAVAEGCYRCWCGSETPCEGGAQRMVGCPVFVGGLVGEHTRHRSDFS